MRLWLLAFILGLLCHSTNASSLSIEEVSQYRDQDGIVIVNDDNYERFGKGLREFYSVVFITSDKPNSGGETCDLCKEFEPNMRSVSRSILNQLPKDQSDRIVFFKVDLAYNPIFLKEFQVTKIPFCLVYPPQLEVGADGQDFGWKHSVFYQYVIRKENMKQPIHFGDFLAKILNVFISIDERFEYDKFIQAFCLFVVVFVVFKKKILPLIENKPRFFLGCASIAIIMISISGYNFTSIKHIPFIAQDDKGQIMWFSGGSHYQFGIEVLTISLLYTVLGGLTVALCMVQFSKRLKKVQKCVLVMIIAASLFYIYMYFLSIIKIKYPGYPYGLL
ncbi:dolichyl-diphosphooligosaccharide--protein glycotransferase [Kluyveromyces lactis]|uniref:KLLA0B01199p n=1 Tax=Kluyveromyces lactis (strain ATCC 8585 / CBS 2359 / DSM 70799 / NBRC 1267 / NRRL Y-1140 / WM37) TaxID=284590 RepID=Q6CWV5_KLULA|nr:uncharacterized protein KLLA0_B01199g [Kluyveromyces lactis]CAH01977.1 KLLA0B01199p [Kluyveromyces lactis]|eukprot:XP_451584.1 uncharacterized protein KLLA0_B01199g [Kluyveromyces lactis]